MYFCDNSYQINGNVPEPYDADGVLKFIENIGRICYRSHDRINDDSAVRFVEMLRNRKHWAMLEHYIFVMSISPSMYFFIYDKLEHSTDTEFIKCMKYVNMSCSDDPNDRFPYVISGSATAFNYLWGTDTVKNSPVNPISQICMFLKSYHPHLMLQPEDAHVDDHIDPDIKFLSFDDIDKLPANRRWLHKWMSCHFVIERSSIIDLTRHRPASYAIESTRFCDYTDKGLCFIIPTWLSYHDRHILMNESAVNATLLWKTANPFQASDELIEWLNQIQSACDLYTKLIKVYKRKPEDAKSILPHSLRAETNLTAPVCEWYHIFEMRAESHAFPALRSVMIPLLDHCIFHEDRELYSPLKHLVEEGAEFIDKFKPKQ